MKHLPLSIQDEIVRLKSCARQAQASVKRELVKLEQSIDDLNSILSEAEDIEYLTLGLSGLSDETTNLLSDVRYLINDYEPEGYFDEE